MSEGLDRFEQPNPHAEGLYSYRGGEPRSLPLFVRTPSGQVYSAEWAVEHAEEAGWTKVPDAPPIDAVRQRLHWDGSLWVVVDKTEAEIDAEWKALRNRWAGIINREAVERMERHVTPGVALVYERKIEEARALLKETTIAKRKNPDPVKYKFLSKTCERTGTDGDVVANQIIARYDEVQIAISDIEARRQNALVRLDEAVALRSEEMVNAILPVAWEDDPEPEPTPEPEPVVGGVTPEPVVVNQPSPAPQPSPQPEVTPDE